MRITPKIVFLAMVVFLLAAGCQKQPVESGAAAKPEAAFSKFYDFQGLTRPDWSAADIDRVGHNTVLGIFNDEYEEAPDNTRLTVGKVPPGSKVTVSFELYFIGTWDSGGKLADRWTLSVEDGPVLIDLTEFPCKYSGDKDKGEGPVGHDGMVLYRGHPRAYWITEQTATIEPDAIPEEGPLVLVFDGNVTGRRTENWALDNVRVTVEKL
jgi:hypothetical protein